MLERFTTDSAIGSGMTQCCPAGVAKSAVAQRGCLATARRDHEARGMGAICGLMATLAEIVLLRRPVDRSAGRPPPAMIYRCS